MTSHERQFTVWERLCEQTEPISLLQLLSLLGSDYSERTVRRWMAQLVDEGLVEQVGKGPATRYKAIAYASESGSCFTPASLQVIEKVCLPLYKRSPTSYDPSWLEAYQPNETFYMPLSVRSKLYKFGRRSRDEEPAGTYARHIFHRLLVDLSFNSSRLEGNTYSLLETERLILKGAGAEGKLDEERVMILNHKEAIRYLVENAARVEVNEDTIFTLHYLLADSLVEPNQSGKVRDHGVRISGSAYIPYENPERLETELRRICEKGALIADPFEQSLFLLIHITYLQAFIDVNKRTARLCANIPLIKNNLVPLSFNDVPRNDYSSAVIAVYEMHETGPITDLVASSYVRTCELYDATVRAMGFDEVRVRYRQARRAILREVILGRLVGEALRDFINAESERQVPEKDRAAFIQDVHEDLQLMDQARIAGLGVTPEQLAKWQHSLKAASGGYG